ncbi:LOG family protein [Angustibacter aerolatus]
MASVCVFCASSEGIDPRYPALATSFGSALAARGHELVSGGGRVSMMGAVARAVRAGGGRTTGVIPQALVDLEVADTGADDLLVVSDMRARKGLMDARSDAFVVLPGGVGTLEELLEVWTSRSLGMHAKPVVVLDPWDDLAGLRSLVAGLAEQGFVRPGVGDHLVWTTDVDAALDAVERGLHLGGAVGAP